MQCLEQVEDVASHRSHSGTTADEYDLVVGILDEEFAVRAADGDLVSRFERVDVRRADTRIYRNPLLLCPVERRSRDTHVQHDDVALCRVVGH